MYIHIGGLMNTSIISRWGNSDAIRIPAKVMKTAGLKTGDIVSFEIDEERGNVTIHLAQKKEQKRTASGILHKYAKKNPDIEAERKAIAEGIAEKYAKIR